MRKQLTIKVLEQKVSTVKRRFKSAWGVSLFDRMAVIELAQDEQNGDEVSKDFSKALHQLQILQELIDWVRKQNKK